MKMVPCCALRLILTSESLRCSMVAWCVMLCLLRPTWGQTPETVADKSVLHADPVMDKVIQAVIDNERLYNNLEVTTRQRHIMEGNWVYPTQSTTVRVVRQQDRLYAERRQSFEKPAGTPVVYQSETAFDGQQTVSIEHGLSVNRHAAYYEPSWVYPPHCWALVAKQINFPLSVYLRGTSALGEHPKVRQLPREHGSIYECYKVESEYVGEEQLLGLDSIKLRVRRWYYTNDQPEIQYLWLIPDRNYLCARVQSMARIENGEMPASDSRVRAFAQVKPGLWLPRRVSIDRYQWKALRRGDLVKSDEREFLDLEDVVLDPEYANETFVLESPEGLPEFRFDGDDLVDSPRHPRPSAGLPSLTLPELVAAIAEQETRYPQYDIKRHDDYIHHRPGNVSTDDDMVMSIRSTTISRTVRDGDRWLFSSERRSRAAFGEPSISRRLDVVSSGLTLTRSSHGTEGESSPRVNYACSVASSRYARVDRPHMMLLQSNSKHVPLSFLLSQTELGKNRTTRQKVHVTGTAVIDDHECYSVRRDLLDSDGKVTHQQDLWLAVDRNLLPIRVQWRQKSQSENLPTGLHVVMEFREVSEGLWIPRHIRGHHFGAMHAEGLVENRMIPTWTKECRVESAEFGVAVDDDQLVIDVPKGAALQVQDRDREWIGKLSQQDDGAFQLSIRELDELRKKRRVSRDQQRLGKIAVKALMGTKPPAFEHGQWLQGGVGDWDDLRGRNVVVWFWAEWWDGWEADLEQLMAQFGSSKNDADTVVIGIHVAGGSLDQVKQTVEDMSIPFPVYVDAAPNDPLSWGKLSEALEVRELPTSVFVGPKGAIQGHGSLKEALGTLSRDAADHGD